MNEWMNGRKKRSALNCVCVCVFTEYSNNKIVGTIESNKPQNEFGTRDEIRRRK